MALAFDLINQIAILIGFDSHTKTNSQMKVFLFSPSILRGVWIAFQLHCGVVLVDLLGFGNPKGSGQRGSVIRGKGAKFIPNRWGHFSQVLNIVRVGMMVMRHWFCVVCIRFNPHQNTNSKKIRSDSAIGC